MKLHWFPSFSIGIWFDYWDIAWPEKKRCSSMSLFQTKAFKTRKLLLYYRDKNQNFFFTTALVTSSSVNKTSLIMVHTLYEQLIKKPVKLYRDEQKLQTAINLDLYASERSIYSVTGAVGLGDWSSICSVSDG